MTRAEARKVIQQAGAKSPEWLGEPDEKVKAHKYGAVAKEIDGIKFGSTLEARAYVILKLWERSKVICSLKLQPLFLLQEGFRSKDGKWNRPVRYQADFSFVRDGVFTVCEAKGKPLPTFQIKVKLFRKAFPHASLEIWTNEIVRAYERGI